MADIFDEIDEELKRDRTQALWTRYGKYVIAAAAAVVLGVGASQGYSAWTKSQAESAADAYHQALAAEDAVTALESSLGDLTDGYALLGRFQIAAGKARAGDAAAASEAYAALANDSSIDDLYREAALLLSVMNAPEDSDPAAQLDRLSSLANGNSSWQPLALELSAALHLKAGNEAEALSSLEAILDLAEAPAELRQRASRLVAVLKS